MLFAARVGPIPRTSNMRRLSCSLPTLEPWEVGGLLGCAERREAGSVSELMFWFSSAGGTRYDCCLGGGDLAEYLFPGQHASQANEGEREGGKDVRHWYVGAVALRPVSPAMHDPRMPARYRLAIRCLFGGYTRVYCCRSSATCGFGDLDSLPLCGLIALDLRLACRARVLNHQSNNRLSVRLLAGVAIPRFWW